MEMNSLFLILFLLSLCGVIIGLFNPKIVIVWGNRKARSRVFLIYGLVMVVFFISYVLTIKEERKLPTTDTLTSTKNENQFELSEAKRKVIWKELVLADDRAANEAEERYPIDPTQSLHVGQAFKLTKETPLMPELEPKDPMTALKKVLRVPSRTTIKILKIAMKGQTSWYYVTATNTFGTYIGTGWINSIALTGQLQVDVKQQAKKQGELEDLLKDKYESELAKKYGLTHKQLESINIEGLENNWPLPNM